MGKPSADEQEPHTRPTWWNELAQHSEVPSFSCGGKWGGWVAEDRVLTWGDLVHGRPVSTGSAAVSNGVGEGREVSRDGSSQENEPGVWKTTR